MFIPLTIFFVLSLLFSVILNSMSLGLRMDPEASDNEIDMSVKRTLDNIKNCDSDLMNNKSELSCDGGSESTPSREDARLSDGSPSGVWISGDEDKSRVTRVIGELPIAEYEGSPRRYGVGQQKISTRSPRPGFPQVSSDFRTNIFFIMKTIANFTHYVNVHTHVHMLMATTR